MLKTMSGVPHGVPCLQTDLESPSNPTVDHTLREVETLLASLHTEEALTLLGRQPMDDRRQNAKAVCLLRLGRFEEAGRVLADLILQQGSLVLKPGLPVAYLLNFATSLFLTRDVDEALRFITEAGYVGYRDPRLIEFGLAIRAWKRALPWRAKLKWIWSGRAPSPTSPNPVGYLA